MNKCQCYTITILWAVLISDIAIWVMVYGFYGFYFIDLSLRSNKIVVCWKKTNVGLDRSRRALWVKLERWSSCLKHLFVRDEMQEVFLKIVKLLSGHINLWNGTLHPIKHFSISMVTKNYQFLELLKNLHKIFLSSWR